MKDDLQSRLTDRLFEFVLGLHPDAKVEGSKIIVSENCAIYTNGPKMGVVELSGEETTLLNLVCFARNLPPKEAADWCELWLTRDDDQAGQPTQDATFDMVEAEPYPKPDSIAGGPTAINPLSPERRLQPEREPAELSSPNSRAIVPTNTLNGGRAEPRSKVSYSPDLHRLLPQAPDAEKAMLSSYLLAPEVIGDLYDENGVTAEQFHIPAHAIIFTEMEALRHHQKPLDFITLTQALRDKGLLDQAGGAANVTELFTLLPTAANAGYYLDIVREKHALREVIKTCTEYAARGYGERVDALGLVTEFQEKASKIGSGNLQNGFGSILAAREFSAKKLLPEPSAAFMLGEAVIATPGNILAVQAKAKAGKSGVIGAFIATAMNATGDTLGIIAVNESQHALFHFDTEQSPYDHQQGMMRALRRAGLEDTPNWVHSYCLTDLPLEQRKAAIRWSLNRAKAQGQPILAVIIDGLADLCQDANDPEESNALVDEMHRLAIEYNTVFICVLHENPGSEIGKTRGHLGSQLERKAETNLRLEKDAEGVTVVFCERGRHCHIPKENGVRFRWSDEAKMHVSTEKTFTEKGKPKKDPNAPRKNAMVTKAKASLGRYFKHGATVQRATVLKNVLADRVVSERTFENHWQELREHGYIVSSPLMNGLFEASPVWAKELAAEFPQEDSE